MISGKDFFEELQEGDEYCSCLVPIEVYLKFDDSIKTRVSQGDILQHTNKFKNDENHKMLMKKYMKARKELRTYEFNKNHNIK